MGNKTKPERIDVRNPHLNKIIIYKNKNVLLKIIELNFLKKSLNRPAKGVWTFIF